jgi:Signal peptidase, peptidase S26
LDRNERRLVGAPTMQPEVTSPETKERKPWIAVVLSLVTLGLGHIYNGEPGRGLAAWLFFVVVSILGDKQLSVNGQAVAEPFALHVDPRIVPAGDWEPLGARDQFGPTVVPPGTFFCLGDNRDNSNDSRFWGPVPNALARGKVAYVYWGSSWSRIGRAVR